MIAIIGITGLGLLVLLGLLHLGEVAFFRGPRRVVYMGSNLREQGPYLKQLVEKYVGLQTKSYTLVEPGAGIGTVSRFLSQSFSWKQIQAIELRPTVFWAGRLLSLFSPITFYRQDLFTLQIPKPAVVYCYLTTTILDQMYASGQLDGNLIICLTFPITGLKPTEHIALSSWQKGLWVYDLRPLARPAHKTKTKKYK